MSYLYDLPSDYLPTIYGQTRLELKQKTDYVCDVVLEFNRM